MPAKTMTQVCEISGLKCKANHIEFYVCHPDSTHFGIRINESILTESDENAIETGPKALLQSKEYQDELKKLEGKWSYKTNFLNITSPYNLPIGELEAGGFQFPVTKNGWGNGFQYLIPIPQKYARYIGAVIAAFIVAKLTDDQGDTDKVATSSPSPESGPPEEFGGGSETGGAFGPPGGALNF